MIAAANVVIEAGAESVQLGWLMGLTTAFFLSSFVGWTIWAFWPSRRQAMEDAARLVIDEGGER